MDAYLVYRIEAGKLDYLAVVTKYPQLKPQIDAILTEHGRTDLIKS
jgi:hypothetical protein